MLSEDQAVEILKSELAKANPYHDERGRFTTAHAQVERAAGDAARAAGVRDYHPHAPLIRDTFRALASAAHAKAQQLAATGRQLIQSTRLARAAPVANGGVEVQMRHSATGGASGRPVIIRSIVQVHPSHVAGSSAASKALRAAHDALVATGHKSAPVRHPPVQAVFSRE